MKKPKHHAWLYPNCFFLFFSIYLFVKFLFVFFFMAGYEPVFLYHLTPFYLLSGLSNVHLLSLSLVLMVLDTYLHLWSSRRKLLLSFLPTTVMITGIGYTMMFNPIDISYVLHYVLFGLLLAVVLIDYQDLLKGIQPTTIPLQKESLTTPMMQQTPAPSRKKPLFARTDTPVPQPIPAAITDGFGEFKKISNDVLQKMQVLLDNLEQKTHRIEQLESRIAEQKQSTPPQTLSEQTSYPLVSNMNHSSYQKDKVTALSSEETIILKEKIQNHLVIDGMNDVVAVVQRGVFKEISNSLAGFLGYERTELLQKNFFVFIAPRGFEDARKYYLNRLKGICSNSFRTILLTKEKTEILVEITVTPTIYKGDPAEFLCITQVKNEQ